MRFKYVCYIICYIGLLLWLYSTPASAETLPLVEDVGSMYTYTCYEYNCAHVLATLLGLYNSTCSFYDVDEPSVIGNLTLYRIPTLVFEDYYEEHFPEHIRSIGSKGLMHHKFCVFDNRGVLTGSWNPTIRGTYYNDNVVFVLHSRVLAQFYNDARTHLLDRSFTFEPVRVNLSGTLLDARICPLHNCEDAVIREINSATSSIKVLAFTFTSKPIAEALITASRRNVTVEVLVEKTRITRYSAVHALQAQNITVYNDTNPYTMHHKTIIVDNATVITGSYNPTAAATSKNDENLLIIRDSPETLDALNAEWGRLQPVIYK